MGSSSNEVGGSFLLTLRGVDWDRYFCTLFAPAQAREDEIVAGAHGARDPRSGTPSARKGAGRAARTRSHGRVA